MTSDRHDSQLALFHREKTLREAREQLFAAIDSGLACPCCDQFAKRYKRQIHSMMARGLLELWRLDGQRRWVDVKEIKDRLRDLDTSYPTSDFAKLSYWGLIVQMGAAKSDQRTSGLWQITPKGVDFVLGVATVQRYARIYDGRRTGLDGEPVSIREALSSRFSYEELMHGGTGA